MDMILDKHKFQTFTLFFTVLHVVDTHSKAIPTYTDNICSKDYRFLFLLF